MAKAKTLPRNADVAEQLELLADLLEIEGQPTFRVLAYRRAATRIREAGTPVAQLALEGKAKELQGIGATIQDKIVQIVDTGEIEALTKRRKTIPPEVVEFLNIPGLGPKTVRKIWQELGVSTLVELKDAARSQRLRTLPGLGAKLEENVLKSVGRKKKATGPPRALLGRALPALLAVVEVLREHPAAERVSEAGSARRRRETVRDLDIIATASDPAALTEYFTKLAWVSEVAAKGPTKATVVSHDGFRFDLRVVPPECYGNLLQHFTGSKAHNVALREDAVRRGLSVSEYGVAEVESGEVFTTQSEEELYERLGYQFIPPELRENAGELEAARRGELPELVGASQLRGDLHTHTHWSADGKNTLTEMVEAARARGYAYYAITDHSHYLREGRMEAQAKEIEKVAKRAAPLRLLQGVEVNIKADGTLDVPDEALAGLDWVVASIHTAFDRNPTERVLATMENPHVDCIGHLTGRKLSRREPMEIDIERVVEKALETGTFLEINSQPDRLDLCDVHARVAGEAGAGVVVSSDAHRVKALGYVEFGVAQARRAWLTAEQVANTRTWVQLKQLMKK
ncbi:MAG: DNA polymerase/3'-5' exonuclease PolX [Actinomycetota bacterium]|nr:DNA polymerase/3'-5' exonuclease PolX [Actinomycetota bacterium]